MEIHQVHGKQGLQWILSGICLLYLDADCDGNVVHTHTWKVCFYINFTGISGRNHAGLQGYGTRKSD